MEFSLTDEQLSLQSMITQWCASRGGTQQVRDRYQDKDHSLDPAWAELAELGLAGLLVDPACGGSGGSLLDACIVAEALSASLLTVPFVGSAVLGATAVELFAPAGGRQEWLGEIADGRSVVSVVLDRDLKWPAVGREGVAWEWVPTADVAWMEDGQLVRSAGPKVVRTLDRDLTRTCAEVQLPGDAPGSAGKVSPQEALFLATGREPGGNDGRRAEAGNRAREEPRAVRTSDRQLPGYPAHVRGDASRRRDVPDGDLRGCLGGREP
jgi:hypothetical protein